jgi:hypothetical protein
VGLLGLIISTGVLQQPEPGMCALHLDLQKPIAPQPFSLKEGGLLGRGALPFGGGLYVFWF